MISYLTQRLLYSLLLLILISIVAYGIIELPPGDYITTKINDGTHTAGVVAAAAGNNSFENLDLADFSKALGALPRYALGGAAWYISPAGYHASIERLQMAAGGLTLGDIASGGLPRFLGLPVIQTLVMDKILGEDSFRP